MQAPKSFAQTHKDPIALHQQFKELSCFVFYFHLSTRMENNIFSQ